MQSVDDPKLCRNYGFWSVEEQQALLTADVAVAGVGGDGYLLALSLVRMGVGRLRVADPEVFELENFNRVPGATHANLGRPKVDCFHEDALDINPAIKLDLFREGVTPGNVAEFLDGADLVIDESELTRIEIGVTIADHARLMGIPNLQVMNIGFAAQVTSFHPVRRPTFRDMVGFSDSTPVDELARTGLDLASVLPFLPPYLDEDVFVAAAGGAPLPSIVQGVNLASALGASQAFLHLAAGAAGSRRPTPIWFPDILYIDALTGQSMVSSDIARTHRESLRRMRSNKRQDRLTRLRYPLDPSAPTSSEASCRDPSSGGEVGYGAGHVRG